MQKKAIGYLVCAVILLYISLYSTMTGLGAGAQNGHLGLIMIRKSLVA